MPDRHGVSSCPFPQSPDDWRRPSPQAPQPFAPPPTIDAKGKALFAERCSICHDQKESRAPATAYLATRLPSEIIYT